MFFKFVEKAPAFGQDAAIFCFGDGELIHHLEDILRHRFRWGNNGVPGWIGLAVHHAGHIDSQRAFADLLGAGYEIRMGQSIHL